MDPKKWELSLEYDTYFFSTNHSNIVDFHTNEKTKILIVYICPIMNSDH